jgi:hypothetical protein
MTNYARQPQLGFAGERYSVYSVQANWLGGHDGTVQPTPTHSHVVPKQKQHKRKHHHAPQEADRRSGTLLQCLAKPDPVVMTQQREMDGREDDDVDVRDGLSIRSVSTSTSIRALVRAAVAWI